MFQQGRMSPKLDFISDLRTVLMKERLPDDERYLERYEDPALSGANMAGVKLYSQNWPTNGDLQKHVGFSHFQ